MSALTTPKGPLPARVYWFRRLLLLSVVLLVVFTTARLLADSGDGESAEAAVTVSAQQNEDPDGTQEQDGTEGQDAEESATDEDGEAENSEAGDSEAEEPTPSATSKPKKPKKAKKTPPPLPEPDGVCANEDVVVTPAVAKKRTGPKVKINLVLRAKDQEACTWEVSPSTVTVKIDSGKRNNPDDIWQSRHCPAVVPTKEVVLYAGTDTVVPITWNGRRSDSDCSGQTDWAKLGWYHIRAAAYAGEPTDVQFELTRPSPVTVTRTVEPEPKKNKKKQKNQNRSQGNPKPERSPKPSGAVEPDL